MLEIDCRKCENLSETCDSCKLYGNDPKKAAAACKTDLFMNYRPRKETPTKIAPGKTAWVIVRDEDGNAVEVAGYIFVARVAGAVIMTPRVNTYDLAGIMQYHIEQTAEFEETELVVFPASDCYATKTDAKVAIEVETEG